MLSFARSRRKGTKAILVASSGDVARAHLMDSLLDEIDALEFPIDAAMREDALAIANFTLQPLSNSANDGDSQEFVRR